MPKAGLIAELRRRKVFGVAAAYAVIAWGVIQVSATVLQMANAPGWIARVVLIVVALGFPVALVLAWVFDISEHGLVRTGDSPNARAAPPTRARVLAASVVIGVLVLSGFAIWLRPSNSEVEFTQLTNFADAAISPALSPDGKTLAFLKGNGYFAASAALSQVYVKQLPNGEAVQLTHSTPGKATPGFTPDGARIVFTTAEGNFDWHTHSVSTHGGNEVEVLPNASGLTWLDSTEVLYAEVKRNAHMGLRRSRVDRAGVRDVYWPPGEFGMAHRAAASPDRKWVVLAEMEMGIWLPCRLVPADGSTRGRQVGPLNAQCTHAAWSPDGRWLYFSANAGGAFHLWRQRFPKGEPEQITHGPTEEEGIAVAPDGRSLITSAGVRHNSIWLLGENEDRQISTEEYAFNPLAARNGERIYYLRRAGSAKRAYSLGNLTVVTLANGAREELLPEHTMVHFDLSADDRRVVFVSGSSEPGQQGIWVAPLDRSAPARLIRVVDTERAFFDPAGNIYFLQTDGAERFVHRLRAPDYTTSERVAEAAARFIFSISPDGEWIVVVAPGPNGLRQIALPTRGGQERVLCSFCGGGAGPARVMAPGLSWTRDGRALLVSGQLLRLAGMAGAGKTIVIPARLGAALPDLPASGITSQADYVALPGAREIPKNNVLPGATADQLLFYETTTIRNLYRVTLPK
jgi:eukaryotic-like serine/threonine-protein kinase